MYAAISAVRLHVRGLHGIRRHKSTSKVKVSVTCIASEKWEKKKEARKEK